MNFRMSDTALRRIARRCWPKIQYKSKGAADAHLRSLLRAEKGQNVETLRSYQCRHCKHWHVGHLGGV